MANKEKVIPHYLRASKGSCHDSCKHGKSHSFKEMVKKPLQKKTTAAPLLTKVSGENKEKALNQKSPLNIRDPSRSLKMSSAKPKTSLNVNKVVRKESASDTKKIPEKKTSGSSKNKPLSTRKHHEIVKKEDGNKLPGAEKEKSSSSPVKPKPKTSLNMNKVVRKEATTDTKKIPEKKTYLRKSESGSSKNKPLFTRKQHEIVKEDDNKLPRAEKEKISSSSPVKPKPAKPKPLSSSSSSENSNITHRKGSNTTISKASTKKVLAPKAPFPSNLTKFGNVKSLPYSKVVNRTTKKVDKTKIPEKIRGPISSLPSPPSLPHEEETEQCNGEANNIIILEKKETKTQVFDSNSSRRLGFRRAGDEGTSEKIVLKHQELGKKNCQALPNNVIIEQTATKLVESRKGKVKALVGAFETVISLQ